VGGSLCFNLNGGPTKNRPMRLLSAFKREFKIDQKETHRANAGIRNDNRPQDKSYAIHQPYDSTGKHDDDCGQAQVAYALALPCLINLRYKGDGSKERSEQANYFDPRHSY
jgi:hypothetical protein